MEIVRPFAPVLGAMIVKEDHENLLHQLIHYRKASGSVLVSSDKRILKKYSKLELIIINKFYEFINASDLLYSNDFIITTSWVVKTPPRQKSEYHFHKNCFYSGIYYFEDHYEPECGNLSFQNPLQKFVDFEITPETFNEMNCQEWGDFPKPHQLVFFPSYLTHRILENKSYKDRYSLAFNIVPIGEYGSNDSTYNTDWT